MLLDKALALTKTYPLRRAPRQQVNRGLINYSFRLLIIARTKLHNSLNSHRLFTDGMAFALNLTIHFTWYSFLNSKVDLLKSNHKL